MPVGAEETCDPFPVPQWLEGRVAAYCSGLLVETEHILYQVEFSGDVDPALARQALEKVIAANVALRSVLVEGNEMNVRAMSTWELELSVVDLRNPALDRRVGRLDEHIQQGAHRPFQLTRQLPIRAELIRWSDSITYLLLTFSHLFVDRWSIQVVINQLIDAYEHLTERHSYTPPPGQQNPFSYVAGINPSLVEASGELLEDVELAALPMERAPREGELRENLVTPLDPELLVRLRSLSRQCQSTLPTLMLSLLALAFWRPHANPRMIVTQWSGRTARNRELVGPLNRNCSVQFAIDESQILKSICQRGMASFIHGIQAFYPHLMFVMEKALEMQQLEPKQLPVVFNFVDDPGTSMRRVVGATVIQWRHIYRRTGGEEDWPTLYVEPTPEGGQIRIGYRPAVFLASTIEGFSNRYVELLSRAALGSATSPVNELMGHT